MILNRAVFRSAAPMWSSGMGSVVCILIRLLPLSARAFEWVWKKASSLTPNSWNGLKYAHPRTLRHTHNDAMPGKCRYQWPFMWELILGFPSQRANNAEPGRAAGQAVDTPWLMSSHCNHTYTRIDPMCFFSNRLYGLPTTNMLSFWRNDRHWVHWK